MRTSLTRPPLVYAPSVAAGAGTTTTKFFLPLLQSVTSSPPCVLRPSMPLTSEKVTVSPSSRSRPCNTRGQHTRARPECTAWAHALTAWVHVLAAWVRVVTARNPCVATGGAPRRRRTGRAAWWRRPSPRPRPRACAEKQGAQTRPAGSPEAALSAARSRLRLPQASASLGHSAAWSALGWPATRAWVSTWRGARRWRS